MPFSYAITLPLETDETVTLQATAEDCTAIAELLKVAAIEAFQAEITLSPRSSGIQCMGHWQAAWQDRCVVSNVLLQLNDQQKLNVRLHWNSSTDNADIAPEDDWIELDSEGRLDIAALLIEYLSLAIPDYPRSAEVQQQEPESEPIEPKTTPFAGLAAMLEAKKDS